MLTGVQAFSISQISVDEIRFGEDRAVKIGTPKVSAMKRCRDKVGSAKASTAQVVMPKMVYADVGPG